MSSVKGKVQQKGYSRDNNSRNKTNSSGPLNGSTADTKVSIDMSDMSSIKDTLTDIVKRLDGCEAALKTVTDLRNDIWEDDGINHRLDYTSNQSEFAAGGVSEIKDDNEMLRREVLLLRSVVIRMDRKIQNMDREITDLRSRSMRDNIVIHNYAYSADENLMTKVPADIKEHLDVDVEFVRIHRNGPPRQSGYPVTITGRLVDRSKKDAILQAQRLKNLNKVKLPFFITAQEPPSVVEQRKRLYEISDVHRKQGINTKVSKNQIILPSGHPYVDDVMPLSNADVLQLPAAETVELDSLDTVFTPYEERRGSTFFAEGMSVKSVDDLQRLYKKACLYCDSASSDHRVYVYRCTDASGKRYESYIDDGEHGAGRRLLRYMRENDIDDVAVVISRWYGGTHIGYERFEVMEKLVCDIANMLDE